MRRSCSAESEIPPIPCIHSIPGGMGFHEALDDKDRAVTRADNEVCESNIAYYDAATSSEFNLEFNIASAFTGFTKLYIQTLAKIVFLGCVTRPHTQRRVTQPRNTIFADLCTTYNII